MFLYPLQIFAWVFSSDMSTLQHFFLKKLTIKWNESEYIPLMTQYEVNSLQKKSL